MFISLLFLFQWLWGPAQVYACAQDSLSKNPDPVEMAQGYTYSHNGDLFPNDLMEHEEWVLLKGLDSVCTDTWCEGSFDFHFYAFKCSFKEQKCLMSYRSWDQTSERLNQKAFSFICVIKANKRTKLFGGEPDFWISSYLYSAVSECVQEGERWLEEG